MTKSSDDVDAIPHSALTQWFESLSQFGVKSVLVLGPEVGASDGSREVVAVLPDSFAGAAQALARSNAFGPEWRKARSPLLAFKNFGGLAQGARDPWVSHFVELGALSLVRIDFQTFSDAGFECIVVGSREISQRADVATIAASALAVWPDLLDEIKTRRFNLSRREREVFLAYTKGATAKKIGDELGCTERTVTFHLTNIKAKFGAKTLGELVHRAGLWGLP